MNRVLRFVLAALLACSALVLSACQNSPVWLKRQEDVQNRRPAHRRQPAPLYGRIRKTLCQTRRQRPGHRI